MLDTGDMATVLPISQDEPCGEALDYDLDFLDLEIMARGRPERQAGDATSPAEPPDWQAVRELATRLAERSHDIRLEILLARTGVHLEGGTGPLAQRLRRIAALIDGFWTHLHPCPEDGDDDLTVRTNALADLADPDGLLADLRGLTLASSRRTGSFSLRDWTAARHDDEAEAQKIVAALAETDAALHEAAAGQLRACLDALAAVDTALRNHVPAPEAPKLAPLALVLTQMLEMLTPYLAPPEGEPAPAAAAELAAEATAAVPSRGPRNRDDIVVMLDRICAWYRLNEPASPIPALLERARALVAKDFLALLQELAPDGAAQFRHLAGLKTTRTDE
ncbi:type VI secretion system protein TssA [Falsirhodobacter sp. 20TX0035]|uniref:type VI secretion system protein TssA n=1 Tax=Falsirhodobacter sp. 20TX0035 TaxID=3022019 RepID=UPI00232F9EC6|nr:type VI secretion system protein TssA [Falsirhodobacter sp. 20TX0035]MDB6453066.1 type VI secretion system protein TssA [Falsirhodobacter sp. 20TX0035]